MAASWIENADCDSAVGGGVFDEYFDDLCVFKMEYKMKKNARGKTYLLLHLLSHRKIIVENDSQLNKL